MRLCRFLSVVLLILTTYSVASAQEAEPGDAAVGVEEVEEPAGADNPIRQAVAECAAKEGELIRLDCYDRLAADLGVDGPQPGPAAGTGAASWTVTDEVNPLDDSRTVALLQAAEDSQSKYGEPIALVLRCQSGKLSVFIVWNEYLGNDARVTSRIGSAEAETRGWSVSSNKTASFYPGNEQQLINAMLGADRFVAQVTPYNESPRTAVFDLSGLDEVLPPLLDACR